MEHFESQKGHLEVDLKTDMPKGECSERSYWYGHIYEKENSWASPSGAFQIKITRIYEHCKRGNYNHWDKEPVNKAWGFYQEGRDKGKRGPFNKQDNHR